MPIVAIKDMLQHAHDNGYAVATFEIGSLEILTGIIMAAEQNQSPVILAVTESQLNRPGIDLLMPAIEAAAQYAKVPRRYSVSLPDEL